MNHFFISVTQLHKFIKFWAHFLCSLSFVVSDYCSFLLQSFSPVRTGPAEEGTLARSELSPSAPAHAQQRVQKLFRGGDVHKHAWDVLTENPSEQMGSSFYVGQEIW